VRPVAIVGSLAMNALLLALLALFELDAPPPDAAPPPIRVIDVTVAHGPGASPANAGGAPAQAARVVTPRAARARVPRPMTREQAYAGLEERIDAPPGGGDGGDGRGHGGGFGDGEGSGVAGGAPGAPPPMPPMPPPPPPPPDLSLARGAALQWPMRDMQADDDHLYIARVKIDTDGNVIGVHMLKTHPGKRGELAEQWIWSFHYKPARDRSGHLIEATIDQPFMIR